MLWEERINREPWLFNGAKFRLHSTKWTTPHSLTSGPHDDRGAQVQGKTMLGMRSDKIHKHAQCGSQSAVSALKNCSGDGLVAKSPKDTACLREPVQLCLQLGLTCYKDYLGTNWSKNVGELRKRGEVELGDPQALLAQPLGVGAILATTDGQMVLLKRSQKVAEAAGLLDIPGGHPEPKASLDDGQILTSFILAMNK